MQGMARQFLGFFVLNIVSTDKIPPITEWKLDGNKLTFHDWKKVTELQANVFCQVPSQVRVVEIYAPIRLFDDYAFDGLQEITHLILQRSHLHRVRYSFFKDVKQIKNSWDFKLLTEALEYYGRKIWQIW